MESIPDHEAPLYRLTLKWAKTTKLMQNTTDFCRAMLWYTSEEKEKKGVEKTRAKRKWRDKT